MRTLRIVVAATLIGLLPIGPVLASETNQPTKQLNWPTPSGHFFTQANGFPLGSSPKGYSVTDDEALFWRGFQSLGGVDKLGYPVSRRFMWGGFLTQLTQKAMLQWRPEQNKVVQANILDDLSLLGMDDWLFAFHATPKPLEPEFDDGKDWDAIVRDRLALLQERPAIHDLYHSIEDPMTTYGLPTSRINDHGNHYAVRLQRVVIQEWKVDTPWAKAGDVTLANAGDLFKAAVDLAEEVELAFITTWPENPPDGQWDPNAGYNMVGKATWYGGWFHGRVMASGLIFDENDPTTIACNAYPLGSRLLVRRLDNQGEIIGVVRDTGGFKYPIVVDLSKAGFIKLGSHPGEGVVGVEVVLLPPE